VLGDAYEYLIYQFADDAGKKGGEFYTPRSVVRLLVELLQPREGMRICDPTFGSAGMLIFSADYVAEQGGDRYNLRLEGQERNLGTFGIGKLNLLLHGLASARLVPGDVIVEPGLVDQQGRLQSYDRVIANPPFSMKNWGHDFAPGDPHHRFDRYGAVPPRTRGDLAFLLHMLGVTNAEGMVGVVMPHGVLFRGGAEGKIRKGIVDADLFEAIIGLAPNLFYGASIPVAICILNKDKPPEGRGKVLFVDANQPDYFRAGGEIEDPYFGEGSPPFREAFLEWRRRIAKHGWIAPAWPKEYGGAGLGVLEQFVLNEEFAKNRVPRVGTDSGVMMAGPTIIAHGSEPQQREHLSAILTGETIWCQGFSEPGSGSDLASPQTRAVRDGDDHVLNGQKIWTSSARLATWIFDLV